MTYRPHEKLSNLLFPTTPSQNSKTNNTAEEEVGWSKLQFIVPYFARLDTVYGKVDFFST